MTSPPVSRTRDERLLYVVLLFVLESAYGWALYASPSLRAWPRLFPFTALMLIHAGLHLFAPRFAPRRRWLPPYFAVQSALVVAITWMARDSQSAYVFYLYAALAAQAVALLDANLRRALLPVAAVLTLGLINYGWLWGWGAVPGFAFLAAPQTFFVLAFMALFIRQGNARKRAQELLNELEAAHRQLAEYAAQVEDLTLSAERQRMARELHDTLAQGLAGLTLQLEAADAQLTRRKTERAQAIIGQAMERARLTLADARRVIDDLRAGDTASDLAEMIRAEVERFAAATGIHCHLDLAAPLALPDGLRDSVFRIVAEGLTNVARHARAREVHVRLAQVDGALEASVRDDGDGFDAAAVNGRAGHYGLIGLRERARLTGGILDVQSAPGKGTTVILSVPRERLEIRD